jgi:hypothetical protein
MNSLLQGRAFGLLAGIGVAFLLAAWAVTLDPSGFGIRAPELTVAAVAALVVAIAPTRFLRTFLHGRQIGLTAIAIVAAFMSVSWAGAAWAAAAAGADTTIDLTAILYYVIDLAAAALFAVLSWAGGLLARKLKLEADSEVRRYLDEAIRRAIDYGVSRAREFGKDLSEVDVRSEIVADAVDYLIPKIPDALKRFGITPDALADMVRARLPA